MLMPARAEGDVTWGRRKLLIALVGLMALGVLLMLGLVWSLSKEPRKDAASRPSTVITQSLGGNADWPELGLDAALPGPLTTTPFDTITLPTPRHPGAAGVSTGFPRTDEGAVAQLAAIDQAALQGASVESAQRIVQAWALPGGPTPETWSGTRAIASMLSQAGPLASARLVIVTAEPAMALVRESDGSTVEVCVDFVATVTINRSVQVASADCQRLAWSGGHWLLAPGPEPSQAPSVWPGTEQARRLGFRMVTHD